MSLGALIMINSRTLVLAEYEVILQCPYGNSFSTLGGIKPGTNQGPTGHKSSALTATPGTYPMFFTNNV